MFEDVFLLFLHHILGTNVVFYAVCDVFEPFEA